MNYKSFREFEKDYSVPYAQKKYDEVLDLLDHSAELLSNEEYEENLFTIMLDKARIYSELQNSIECFSIIKNMLKKGYAFPLHWPRFNFLKSNNEYQAIKVLNEKLLKETKEKARFKYEVHLPKTYNSTKKYPLFFSLHGDGADGNIPNHRWYWKPDMLLQKDFIVVYPQSSQVYCHNGFGWLIDPLLSRKEIKSCYEQLIANYSIDEKQVIIGGFSGGANAAVDIVMSNTIPTKGFVALCPGDKVMTFEIDAAKNASQTGAKGVVLEGELETEAPVQDMLKVFKEVCFPCEYYINKGVGHWYPEDLDEKVSRAVDFIFKG